MDAPITYTWDFGDGSPSVSGQSPTIKHTYRDAGEFTAIITATNGTYTVSTTSQVLIKKLPAIGGTQRSLADRGAAAMSWVLLLPLLVVAAGVMMLRRRRKRSGF